MQPYATNCKDRHSFVAALLLCIGGEASREKLQEYRFIRLETNIGVRFAGTLSGVTLIVNFDVHRLGGAERWIVRECNGGRIVEDDSPMSFASEFGESLQQLVGLPENLSLEFGGEEDLGGVQR